MSLTAANRRKQSAGLLVYRRRTEIEVFLVHPGGPYWANKDSGAWSIPKGELEDGEDPLTVARREFTEETGFTADGDFLSLATHEQKGGKLVHAWAIESDYDAALARSNSFSMEWPPRSGKQRSFPEVDRAEWFTIAEARARILSGQVVFLDRLLQLRFA